MTPTIASRAGDGALQEPSAHNGVLVAQGYGLRLSVERGHLIVEDGFGNESRRRARFPRVGSGIKRVIVLGHSGTVSLEALRWLHELDIAFVQIGPDGELIASGAPSAIRDTRLRRGQAIAMHSAAGLSLSRDLIAEKLRGQSHVLDLIEGQLENRTLVHEMTERLETAETLEALRFFESRAAAAYWNAWERIPIHFAGRDSKSIPSHWRSFGTRRSLLTSSARKASSPGNALLNYLYAILEAESTLAAIAVGCDPGMGIIHTDMSRRDSFACDLMEPVRPSVDMHVLKLLSCQTFAKSDFFEMRDGNCRLMPEVTQPLAATAPIWARAVAPWAERLAGALSQLPLALAPMDQSSSGRVPARHRTPLTQRNRSRQKRTQASAELSSQARMLTRCRSCGVDLGGRKRVYCDTCLPMHAAIASKKAVETQAMLRAIGQDKRSSSEVRDKHRADAVRQNALNAAWEAEHLEIPSPTVFRREILPSLKSVPISQMKATSGLSESSCKKIRAGDLVPHPRHWAKLRNLA
jgi:CRISPR-associated endonuclease Cas1